VRGNAAAAHEEETKLRAIQADKDQVIKSAQSVADNASDTQSRLRVAEIAFRLGEERRAALWLHQLLNLDPRHLRAHQLLADYYEKKRRSSTC